MMKIKDGLLALLACPQCKGSVVYNDVRNTLQCDKCALLYEVKEGIPVMLVSEAISLNNEAGHKAP